MGAQVILLQELFETPYFCKTQQYRYLDLARHPEVVEAAERAGFRHLTLLEEPQAAFYDFINIGHGWAGGWAGVIAIVAFGLLTLTLVLGAFLFWVFA